jgi:hypothetical protein
MVLTKTTECAVSHVFRIYLELNELSSNQVGEEQMCRNDEV